MTRHQRDSFMHMTQAAVVLGLFAFSCGSDGAAGPAGPPGPPGGGGGGAPSLGLDDLMPGLDVTISSIAGGTGTNGNFLVGDQIRATFTFKRADNGDPIDVTTLSRGNAMVSGPTFNYQRVITSQGDVRTTMVDNLDGSYTYTFPPLPATYSAPYNDTPSFTDDVLTGQPLLDGTYTIGFEFRADYDIEGDTYRDPANAIANILIGGATTLDKREVVTNANCMNCHERLSFHGGNRIRVESCLLCHTAGAEDKNTASVEGGTPGVSVEFKVMIHKIHAGANLAQVQGVTTNTNGTRDYSATPKPYKVLGYRDSVHDFSDIQFPVWPSLSNPMPRDGGYDGLSSANKAQEDAMRRGPVSCDSCHGDPDGAGPLPPPEDAGLATTNPTRRACGSCHDDWVWNRPYSSSGLTMPPQSSDASCTLCHGASGDGLAVVDAHRHPLVDPTKATGVIFDITALVEGGINNANNKLDPGEKPQVSFTVKDSQNNDLALSSLSRIEAILSGPTMNPNMILETRLPTSGLGAGPTYTTFLPEKVHLEWIGTSTSTNNESFSSTLTPHWTQTGYTTSVFVRTGQGASSTLASAVMVDQNYIDLAPGGGASFARNDYIVIEDGAPSKEEYLRVQFVDNDRLWFSSIHSGSYNRGLVFAHATVSAVRQVTLAAKTITTDYTLNAATGTITEVTEFGTGNKVLVTYTTDFVLPATYKGTLNESPDLDSSWGDWIGQTLVSGTYRLDLHGRQPFTVTVLTQGTNYNDVSLPAMFDFLVGTATTIETPERISSVTNCYKCHNDITFHGGGRRGVESCLQCHGVAGAEDRPRYIAGGAPATPGTTIDFRTMLHKIHSGKELSKANSYEVIGYGSSSWPNNFTAHTYEKIGFPTFPSGVKRCVTCHGAGNKAWIEPAPRNHPLAQGLPTRVWRAACIACHDSDGAGAHIDVNTSPSGFESCQVCHGPGKAQGVERMHLVR